MGKFIAHSKCCTDPDDVGTEPQDCVDIWENDYKDICILYDTAKATTDLANTRYTNSLSWKTKLKNWNELVSTTDEKAKLIVTELDFLLEQVNGVCTRSECTSEAIGKLACLVKGIFDCLYSYTEAGEGLKDKIKEFKKAVECLKNLGDEEKADVIKCIEDYENKINLVCELQDAILNKLIETLKCAKLLYAAICKDGGLREKLISIRNDFNGETPEEEHHCAPHDGPETDEATSNPNKYPCDDKAAKPVPVFPISEGDYYNNLKTDLEIACDETETKKGQWIQSKKESDKKLAKKNSLADAIAAATAAESGK